MTFAYVLLWIAVGTYAIHLLSSADWAGWVASGATMLAWGLLTGALLRRGLDGGHWPLTNRYEFALCLVWAIVAVYLLLEMTWDERRSGAFGLAMALLVATFAVTRPDTDRAIAPLTPMLRSVWLQIHVLTAAVAYGAFGVAAGLGMMRLAAGPLLSEGQLSRSRVARGMERTIALGFPWFTLSMLSGAIWAQEAWGRYWGWDPKETWALIVWMWYLLILHVVPRRSWRGWRLAVLVVTGFALVLFALIGLPWLARVVRIGTLHGF